MTLWARMEDVLFVTFLIPKKNPSKPQMVGFHLFLPMGYVDSAPYFSMLIETVAELTNKSITQQDVASAHPLEQASKARAADNVGAPEDQADSSWEQLTSEQRSSAKANVDVYLDDLISVVQGGPKEM